MHGPCQNPLISLRRMPKRNQMKPGFAFLLFILLNSSWAQTPGVFDRNCESFARNPKNLSKQPKRNADMFINGTIDKDKPTERFFNWNTIVSYYKGLVDRVNPVAKEYYRKNNRPPIHACGGTSLNQCLAFQAYCTETISKIGIKEEVTKWSTMVQNCRNKNYIKRYPQHCSEDHVDNLLFVYDAARALGEIDAQKNPEASRYFKEAAQKFSQYKDEMKALLAEQKRIKEDEENIKAVKQMMKDCSDIVELDDNDIKGRNISDKVLSGLGACAEDSLVTKDQVALENLIKDMKPIVDKISFKPILDETNKIAIQKSAKAHWASYKQLVNGKDLSKDEAVKLVCHKSPDFCQTKEGKALLEKTYDDSKADLTTVEHLTPEKLDHQLSQFNSAIDEMNKVCALARHEYSDNMRLLQEERSRKALEESRSMIPKVVSESTYVATNMRQKEEWFLNERLMMAVHGKLQNKYMAFLQGNLGHLMLTDSLKNKVGVLNPKNLGEKCARGKGHFLKRATPEDIQKAKGEFLDLTGGEFDEIAGGLGKKNDDARKDALKEYLKTHPLTIAELLKKNKSPDYAKAMCSLIRDINNSDEQRQKDKATLQMIGMIGSFALAATGIGAPLGAALFATVTATTVATVAMTYEDYENNKAEALASLRSGSTGQMTVLDALTDSKKREEDAEENMQELKEMARDQIVAAGLGATLKVAVKGKDAFKMPGILRKNTGYADESSLLNKQLSEADEVVEIVNKTPHSTPTTTLAKNLADKGGRNAEFSEVFKKSRKEFADKIRNIRKDGQQFWKADKDMGWHRALKNRKNWDKVSVEKTLDELYPGQELEYIIKPGGKFVVMPKVRPEGSTVNTILFDQSGKYFRIERGVVQNGKVKISKKYWEQYTDAKGKLLDPPDPKFTPEQLKTYEDKFLEQSHFDAID